MTDDERLQEIRESFYRARLKMLIGYPKNFGGAIVTILKLVSIAVVIAFGIVALVLGDPRWFAAGLIGTIGCWLVPLFAMCFYLGIVEDCGVIRGGWPSRPSKPKRDNVYAADENQG